MEILLCGADGFLGRHFEAALLAAGHRVRRGVRRPSRPGDIVIDYRRDLGQDAWLPRLEGVDAVINAVGILNERQPQDFERIHHRAPAALFAACAQRGIGRVIQVSALGAERRNTPYLASKAAADDCLLAACPDGVVVRPSLVFGPGGASSRFFLALASLPLTPLPGRGGQILRPIHIDDLAELVVRLLAAPRPASGIVPAVGGEAASYRNLLAAYRQGMGFAPALAVATPACLMSAAAALGSLIPASLLNRATWSMLQAGNSAEPAATAAVLGRPPRGPAAFIAGNEAGTLRQRALAAWRPPLLRFVLAFVWLWSAAVSLLWPATGFGLLAPFGLAGAGAVVVLAGASLLDATLGVLTLLAPGRRLWLAQMGLIAVYSLLIALRLPDLFFHPFAPVVKNLVILAILFILWAEEEKP